MTIRGSGIGAIRVLFAIRYAQCLISIDFSHRDNRLLKNRLYNNRVGAQRNRCYALCRAAGVAHTEPRDLNDPFQRKLCLPGTEFRDRVAIDCDFAPHLQSSRRCTVS
ncbi:MAG: hypothetical protein H7X80_01390 [bacterium]|nr:hypothetical protein [Candidatus Kapabacteria bacterium]